jgi:phosphoenolpyruvate carboxykinase (ATP)
MLKLENLGPVHRNLSVPVLIEKALARKEGILTSNGALRVLTGKYTGRSPEDKYVVDTPGVHSQVWWGPNRPIPADAFRSLLNRLTAYLQGRELFVFEGFVGADPEHRFGLRVINELAWQNLFARQLFIRPSPQELDGHQAQITVVAAPGFKAEPETDGTRSEAFIVINLEEGFILIGGTHYAGEIKKSVFTVLNYLLPARGVAPMHCSANLGESGDVALFFGLSGTGKTTLSTDPARRLIGDDEHGWSDRGIFNFEGGCYAKCIRLSPQKEPQIWQALRFGAVLENVAVDPETREADFDDDGLTENTRAAYPLEFVPGAVLPSRAGHPQTVIFLTADAFGVLPPVARLTVEQAMYHFLSGYTSRLAGTERGVTEPMVTFSPCFAAPFLPREPMVYARLLAERLRKHGSRVYLVNTGWSGGPYGVGQRMDIDLTRAIVRAAISGQLEEVGWEREPVFGLWLPNACPGVPSEVLRPWHTWKDKDAYWQKARELAARFRENFSRFTGVPKDVEAASPPGT